MDTENHVKINLPHLEEANSPRLYTRNMVFFATALGGILGGCTLIALNFRAVSNNSKALKALSFGIGMVCLIAIIGFFFPLKDLNMPIWAGMAAGTSYYTQAMFGKDKPKVAWWLAILISIASLIINLIIVAILAIIFHISFGVPKF